MTQLAQLGNPVWQLRSGIPCIMRAAKVQRWYADYTLHGPSFYSMIGVNNSEQCPKRLFVKVAKALPNVFRHIKLLETRISVSNKGGDTGPKSRMIVLLMDKRTAETYAIVSVMRKKPNENGRANS